MPSKLALILGLQIFNNNMPKICPEKVKFRSCDAPATFIYNKYCNINFKSKFQALSSNSFQEILLTSLKWPNLQRAITP